MARDMNISGGLCRGRPTRIRTARTGGGREEERARSGADSGELEADAQEVRIHTRREMECVDMVGNVKLVRERQGLN